MRYQILQRSTDRSMFKMYASDQIDKEQQRRTTDKIVKLLSSAIFTRLFLSITRGF